MSRGWRLEFAGVNENRSAIIASVSEMSVSRLIISSASRAIIAAARCCPGTTVYWACGGLKRGERISVVGLAFSPQAVRRAAPGRRSPSGIWSPVSSISAALLWL